MSTTILLYGSIGFGLLLVFEYSRSNSFPTSKNNTNQIENIYSCGRSKIKLPSGFLKWVIPLIKINKEQVLKTAGMDGFVLIRFLNQCLKISSFCLILSLLILFPTYSTGQSDMQSSFGKLTMDHIDLGSNKLWVPFIVNYAITCFVIYCVKIEWDLYVTSRLEFLKSGDPHIPQIAK